MPPANRRPRLHVFQGLPAAGKTTAARKLIADAADPVRYVGLDSLRLMLDGQSPTAWWAEGAEESTSRAQAALVGSLLADGCDVLVDGTHVSPGQVAALRSAVAGLAVEVLVHRVGTPVDVRVARDLDRPHPIGEACIRRLAREWAAAEAAGWRLTPVWLAGAAEPSGAVCAATGASQTASGALTVPAELRGAPDGSQARTELSGPTGPKPPTGEPA